MSDVFVAGAAMLKMGKYPASSYAALGYPPVLAALKDAGIGVKDVDAVFCGSSFGGMLTGQRIAKEIGLGHVPVMNVENACAGGASALRAAFHAVREGQYDIALAIGVEKLTQFGGGTLPLVAEDPEVQRGMVMPALYAMRARRYLHERDATIEDLARISVKARRHGALNAHAQLRKEVTLDEVLASRMIADPLTLFMCCPTGDGAAAVVVVSDKMRRRLNVPAMRIRTSILHSGKVATGFRDMLRPEISFASAREAYETSGVSPDDLNVVELHDAFSIAELIYYEALGLCAAGGATGLLRSGATALGGKRVVNPSGGLLAKGHPVGASGIAQVVEIFWQLTGRADKRQVADARLALSHVTGGGIAGLDHGSCAVHVFEKAA